VEEVDYIIVGAGSAGCVLANKLSAEPARSVLLIESGPPNTSPLIRMPRGIGAMLVPTNPNVWTYDVPAQPGRRAELWLKGRTIGGSSSVNGMVYVRGAPADYDAWESAGCQGWGWRDVGPCFVALEDHELGAKSSRGKGGPLKITVHPTPSELCDAIIEAADQIGTPHVEDINDLEAVAAGGFGYQPRTVWHGKRFSAADAFIAPLRSRSNLRIATGTNVVAIEFTGRRASGVLVRDNSGQRSISCRHEVIVCAGAIESPKLLQLSGIGPGAVLKAAGVNVLVDAPEVGRNLHEHRYLAVQFRVKDGSLNARFAGVGLLGSMLRYFLTSSGPLTHAAHEVGGFIKSRPGLGRPDGQIGVGLYSMKESGQKVAIDDQPGISIGGYFMRPESQGELHIVSPDATAPPRIDPNTFAAEIDRVASVGVFRWIRRLAAQPVLAAHITSELTPGAAVQSDEQILDAYLKFGGTAYHICGTCRMGPDEGSVVDTRLRVRGIEGLRVVDTSIMPTLISGNTNAPAMAIALRAAQLMAQDLS
jgi:choline dehydrogenase-like flavoprotein